MFQINFFNVSMIVITYINGGVHYSCWFVFAVSENLLDLLHEQKRKLKKQSQANKALKENEDLSVSMSNGVGFLF